MGKDSSCGFWLKASCVIHNDDVRFLCGQGYSRLVCRATALTKFCWDSFCNDIIYLFIFVFFVRGQMLCSPARQFSNLD